MSPDWMAALKASSRLLYLPWSTGSTVMPHSLLALKSSTIPSMASLGRPVPHTCQNCTVWPVGSTVGMSGASVGASVGAMVGASVGAMVGASVGVAAGAHAARARDKATTSSKLVFKV